MIPLADHNPTHSAPVLTWALIAACIAAYLYQIGSGVPFGQTVGEYGFIPARVLLGAEEQDYAWPTAPWVTVLTSMFLHGDMMHLGGNMLYLYIFGDNIENALGKIRFVLFYLLGGVIAALTQGAMDTASIVPMIGASGAISAVLGGYLVLYPKQRVTVLVPNFGMQELPAIVVLGLWFGYQFLLGVMASGGSGGVAFWAHVGGFVAGVALIRIFMLGRSAPALAAAKPRLWQD